MVSTPLNSANSTPLKLVTDVKTDDEDDVEYAEEMISRKAMIQIHEAGSQNQIARKKIQFTMTSSSSSSGATATAAPPKPPKPSSPTMVSEQLADDESLNPGVMQIYLRAVQDRLQVECIDHSDKHELTAILKGNDWWLRAVHALQESVVIMLHHDCTHSLLLLLKFTQFVSYATPPSTIFGVVLVLIEDTRDTTIVFILSGCDILSAHLKGYVLSVLYA